MKRSEGIILVKLKIVSKLRNLDYWYSLSLTVLVFLVKFRKIYIILLILIIIKKNIM